MIRQDSDAMITKGFTILDADRGRQSRIWCSRPSCPNARR
ncbi:hypothetical protein CUJ84_pRLN1000077 (plasmid) [Rhizobium leguminosarum]|uniref:Uncharacterized protein n=1 Tax=Rhizobium leguminosarum TaxID=384 RepID=A0A2K9ZBB3_RHILE|nr:hypothetical protein CUJ84_pRLN1000077 [Rhizobium leguminosarum]